MATRSRKDLETELAALKSKLSETSSMTEALKQATQISASAKRLAEEATKEPVYPVKSIMASAVSAEVTDSRGQKQRVFWASRGTVHLLTAAQIEEIRQFCDLFGSGLLSAPELVPPNGNTIEDFDEFIASLSPDQVRGRMQEFDKPEPLWGLYHHLENKRFVMTDDGMDTKQVALSPKEDMVLYATMDRLHTLVGFNFSAHGAE